MFFPHPLLTLCPHDGEIHPVTMFHEIAHLLSCGKYTEVGGNQYTHVCGTNSYTYEVSCGMLLVTSEMGLSIPNEVMTDITAKLILESLSFETSLFSASRLLRMDNMAQILWQHGFSRKAAIHHYLTDSMVAKKALNKAFDEFVLT